MKLSVAQKIKIRITEMDTHQTEIAKIVSERTGQIVSLQRFSDWIHGRRSGEWQRYFPIVADVLGMDPREIKNPTPRQ